MFTVRLVAYPVIEWYIYKKFRKFYHNMQHQIKKGWGLFALIGIMFYVAMILCMCYPSMITERPEYLPVLFILFALMPISYVNILITLRQQQKAHEAIEQENILRLQVDSMAQRMEDLAAADEIFRFERHDFRHKMRVVAALAEKGLIDELRTIAWEYSENINLAKVKRYCQNHVLDAVLSTYLNKAESKNINVTTSLAFPDTIPVPDAELATVFANAIENAINACEKLEPEKRYIKIKVIKKPQFMFQISNSFDGNCAFDENGIPVTGEKGHGLGTRSIVAFCEKHNAYYQFKSEGNTFYLRVKL